MSPSETEEIKRHFNVVAELLQSQLDLVVEEVSGLVDGLDKNLDRLESEMKSGFADLKATIRLC